MEDMLVRMVEHAKQGDEDAFGYIYERFSKVAYYIGLRMTKNNEDANDVMQEVMIKLQQNLHMIENPHAIGAYVNKIAVNYCLDFLRKNKRLQVYDNSEE